MICTWSYNSVHAYNALFPYMGKSQIRRVLQMMVDRKVLLRRNYNKWGSGPSYWYSFVDEETALKGLPGRLPKSHKSRDDSHAESEAEVSS
jgi:predicted FMN-binding regulatory protein PaiB